MTSSWLEIHTNTPGAHRVRHRAPHSSPKQPPARYEPHLDGLFTYCLSVLCDHDAATDALGGVLALAERQGGRCPTGEEERKTWLYALARWTCLRRLAEREQGRQAHRRHDKARARGQSAKESRHAPAAQGARAGRRTPPPPVAAHAPKAPTAPPSAPPSAPRSAKPQSAAAPETPAAAEAHRRELAQLAWPEAAGTTPEQREALELAVRHRLTPVAVAAVLGLEAAAARELLAAAACEVERTRAALAVAESGNCPTVGRLTGDQRVLLSATLRRELVRHVDDCPRCRNAAERAGAEGPWPGAAVPPVAALAVVEAPRPSAYVAMIHAQKHQKNRSATPRFDRAGFPMDPKDHAARRDRLRSRVMTTTVVATVVAAPVIALWSAYRGAPLTGEGHEGSSVTATEADGSHGGDPYGHYANAGNASLESGPRFTDDGGLPDVSAEVISVDTGAGPGAGPDAGRAGALTVEARSPGGTTMITLTASRSGPVAWSARTSASWLRLGNSSGKLAAGGSVTIRVLVDHGREPASHWTARVAVTPSGSVVAIHGYGGRRPSRDRPHPAQPSQPSWSSWPSRPSGTLHPRPRPHPHDPSDPPSSSPDPTEPTPDPPDPTADPTDPTTTPTDPGGPSPSPDPSTRTGPEKSPSVPPPAN
ncbi:BACON domain-containing protein [Streptomyces brevispora]|uniref:BACON domain-containing protein n=1 Tax=Streptomyces brevispora TaxID=887462 RepID=UPI0035D6F0AE